MKPAQTELLANLIIRRRSLIIQKTGLTQHNIEQQHDLLMHYLEPQNSLEAKLAMSQMGQQSAARGTDDAQSQDKLMTAAQFEQLLATHERCIRNGKTEYWTEAQDLQACHCQQQTNMRQQIDDLDASISQYRMTSGLARVSEHSSPPADFDAFSVHIPIVIGKDGKWHEVACCFCGANSPNAGMDSYFAGWPDLARHMNNKHGVSVSAAPQDKLFRWCKRRTLDDYDVDLMHHGIQPRVQGFAIRASNGTRFVQVDDWENLVWRRVGV